MSIEEKLNQVLATQLMLYKRLKKVEEKVDKNGQTFMSDEYYLSEMEEDAKEFLDIIKNSN